MAGVASDSDARASRLTPAGSTSERMQNRIFKNARILIVDDEETNVGQLRRLLERAGFDKVESTSNPATKAGSRMPNSRLPASIISALRAGD